MLVASMVMYACESLEKGVSLRILWLLVSYEPERS